MTLLPAWNGYIRGTMFRLGVSLDELAWRMDVSRTYLSKTLNNSKSTPQYRAKVERALLTCAKQRGITAADLASPDGFTAYELGGYAC